MEYEPLSQFTERILTITDTLLNEPLDPVYILYKKSEDTSLPFESYLTLMRAAQYLHGSRLTDRYKTPFHLQ